MNLKTLIAAVTVILGVAFSSVSQAQTSSPIVSEDFTGATTSTDPNQRWYFFNGACLTAGTSTDTTTEPGISIPGCVSVLSSYYNKQTDKDAAMVGGENGFLGSTGAPSTISAQKADDVGSGALRFTNGSPYGHHENGAIVGPTTGFPTGQGVHITFKTVTYLGDKGGNGASGAAHANDGADGISFYLMDASQTPGIGAWGGSLGYSCSNSNSPHDGLVGAYLGLGIDEFGNFLNGSVNTLGVTNPQSLGDNTASGGGQYANRVGLRGAGNIAWSYLTATYGTDPNDLTQPYYPSSLNSSQQQDAVYNTCRTGLLYNYKGGTATKTSQTIMDYPAIPNAYAILPSVIANESATTRASAVPIVYDLKITSDGLLSLSYSYNGGATSSIIKKAKITDSNGPLPSAFRFGFAGSTGGATNIHEILCFKATAAESTATSGAVNVYEDPTLKKGTQLFLAYYVPADWTGSLTAQSVTFDPSTNLLGVSSVVNWDARCVLTGVTAASGPCVTGKTPSAETPSSRVMLTWNGTQGVPFEWSSLSTAQQSALTAGDATPGANRVAYLRGDTTNEIDSKGNCKQLTGTVPCFRARDSILGDIIDSSPATAGPPQQPYTLTKTWKDEIYPSVTIPENAPTAQLYSDYMLAQRSRENVVYVGANDGFVHGFRAGSQDASGNLTTPDDPTKPNDGAEVLAYMPNVVLNNIHPVDSNNNVIATSDYSNTQYSHAYYVDASPTTGDVFYGDKWHTWVVGGLGAGGAAFYALDVSTPTDLTSVPSVTKFSEANAKNIVIGEWTPTLTCANDVTGKPACGTNMGQTYGSPQIRRFHNGQWGAIFGNGLNSANGASGIYIMLLDKTTGAPSFYYFATKLTPSASTPNGLTNPSSADYDFDHTIDYIYAGDLLGNVWKFDVTSQDPANWGVTASSPLFTAGQPITTHITVSAVKVITPTKNEVGLFLDTGPEREVLAFGTGQQVPLTATSAAQFSTGQQYMYGIWDWDQGIPATTDSKGKPVAGTGWNGLSPKQQAIGLTGPQSISLSNLTKQTLTRTGSNGTMSKNDVCWNGWSNCSPSQQTKMGWYLPLPGTNEQVIFDPLVSNVDGSLIVNTFVPSPSSILSCNSKPSTGFSIGMEAQTGAELAIPLFNVGGVSYDSVERDAMGAAMVLQSGQPGDNNASYLITHNQNGASATQLNDTSITTGQRLYWIQKR